LGGRRNCSAFNGTAWISSGKPGTRRALRDDVAKSHKELRAWKLADVVRRHIVALCARPVVKRDFKFCDQADRAAASACRNIAEGFARYGHAEFARFVSIGRGSLGELRDSNDEARLKRYIGDQEWNELDRAIRGAMSSASALRRYLLRTPTPESRRQRAKLGRNSQPRSGE
jgi:four helix bundle protein